MHRSLIIVNGISAPIAVNALPDDRFDELDSEAHFAINILVLPEISYHLPGGSDASAHLVKR